MKWTLCALLTVFLFLRCAKTAPGFQEPECPEQIDFGTILLTESSRDFFPYTNFTDTLFFNNAEGEELYFVRITNLESNLAHNQISSACPADPELIIRQVFKHETIGMIFEGEDRQSRLFLFFQATGIPSEDALNPIFYDELNVSLFKTNVYSYYMHIISDYRDNREILQSLFLTASSHTDSLDLNGKTFHQVFYNAWQDTSRAIYYSPEVGLAGFKDEHGVLWHFNRFN